MPDALTDYLIDSWQRSILFLDVLRQRGNQYQEHIAKQAPHVLRYGVEVLIDGRKLARPVNYALVRIVAGEGEGAGDAPHPRKVPFIVIDPRAGHGPGIGGFKADSEISVTLKAGHPCYFIGFLPEPVLGQTIEDILHAEAKFVEAVIARHPDAEGKPCVIGNCQAGWALMMLAATRPELFGPILLAGSPLSYWAGVHGKNPMRYTGGLVGGSWPAAFLGDLGHGKFDGAWLVSNFENLNPSNTLWTKQYNLYARVDTEAPRYLEFERWWGAHVNLNTEEMQFIADKLFVGNKLASGEITLSDGTRIDLRRVKGPIVVFCSHGDNITPPQQALGWILDLYDSVDEIRTHGQTIVYSVHESIGHLGIFVSGKVAKKEHDEFASNMDFIDLLPPGLYEAVLVESKAAGGPVDESVGRYVIRFEARTLDDIRALGGNSDEDERRFATAARLSDSLGALYKTLWSPWVKAFASEEMARLMRELHPARVQFSMFSDANPFMRTITQLSDWARANRRAVDPENPLLRIEASASSHIAAALDGFRDARDAAIERWFLAFYGSPVLQAALGIDADGPPRQRPGADPAHAMMVKDKIADLRRRIAEGGLKEAAIRSMLYVGLPRAAADERSFAVLRKLREATPEAQQMPLAELKQLMREQFFMLLLDCPGALAAIPAMLPPDQAAREHILHLIREATEARGAMEPEVERRFAEISRLYAADGAPDARGRQARADDAGVETAASSASGSAGARHRDRARAR
jgi:hypothetical protein